MEGARQVNLPFTHLHNAQQSSYSASQKKKKIKNEAFHIPQYFPPLLTNKDLCNSQHIPERIYQTDDLLNPKEHLNYQIIEA